MYQLKIHNIWTVLQIKIYDHQCETVLKFSIKPPPIKLHLTAPYQNCCAVNCLNNNDNESNQWTLVVLKPKNINVLFMISQCWDGAGCGISGNPWKTSLFCITKTNWLATQGMKVLPAMALTELAQNIMVLALQGLRTYIYCSFDIHNDECILLSYIHGMNIVSIVFVII